LIKKVTMWDAIMGEKLLEHQIAKDYGINAVNLDFERDDMYWALVLYEVERDEVEKTNRSMR
jgi:hypothetical protein